MIRLLSVFLLSLSLLLAQSSRGTVSGIVLDSSGAAVAGAKVELKSIVTGAVRSAETNASGQYRFDSVELGDAEVTISNTGFASFKARGPVVAANTLTVNAKLEVATSQSIVEVAAEVVTLQVEAPVRGANISGSSITQLPVSGRNAVSLALTVPGVSSNRNGFGTQTFSVNGGRGRSNNFRIRTLWLK
jgi:hypothetical protein